jgi:2OG-Fe(II) oxygenase superfamily
MSGIVTARATARPLAEMLENRRWQRRTYPFPHFIAQDVFKEWVYNDLAAAFREVLAKGLSEDKRSDRLSRNMPGYDAYGMPFVPNQPGPFGLFTSRGWHDLIANLVGVDATGHINCGLHHHPRGSKHGWVHNDLNPGWFVDYDSPDGIRVVRHDQCSYAFGKTTNPGVTPVETIRAVAVLYYLNNPAWSPGEGGSTGLYQTKEDALEKPSAFVPPVNNSLLAFECTPYSFHGFISNWRHPRNCMIMWLHRSKASVICRWGHDKIVYWPAERQ